MHRTSLLVATVSAAVATAALAQDRPPDWLKKPTINDLLAVWPTAALQHHVKGGATIACTITLQGVLRDCRVVAENPPGMGFGHAALTLAPQFLMRPPTHNGAPFEGKVQIPIQWAQVPGEVAHEIMDKPEPRLGSKLADTSPEALNANRIISDIPWVQAPTVAEVRAAYPQKAQAEKRDGRAVLDCRLDRRGGLTGCNTIVEEPRGFGFARAARDLAGKFLGPTADGSGQTLAGAHTQVAFTFAASSLTAAAPVIGKPQWTGLPDVSEFNAAFPAPAATAGVLKARVVLNCAVATGGALTDCLVESEDPKGLGFGAAAASLSGRFRLSAWTPEGLPAVGGRVSVPIRWELEQAPQKP